MGIGTTFATNPNNYSLLANGMVNASEFYINDKVVVSSQWETNAAGVSYSDAVGIGTTLANNPNSYRLAVNGKVGAHEVRVEKTSATRSDYVFNPNNRLPALSEVEASARPTGHGGSRTKLLQPGRHGRLSVKKIEELTLYIIQQEKRMDPQQKEIETL